MEDHVLCTTVVVDKSQGVAVLQIMVEDIVKFSIEWQNNYY